MSGWRRGNHVVDFRPVDFRRGFFDGIRVRRDAPVTDRSGGRIKPLRIETKDPAEVLAVAIRRIEFGGLHVALDSFVKGLAGFVKGLAGLVKGLAGFVKGLAGVVTIVRVCIRVARPPNP